MYTKVIDKKESDQINPTNQPIDHRVPDAQTATHQTACKPHIPRPTTEKLAVSTIRLH